MDSSSSSMDPPPAALRCEICTIMAASTAVSAFCSVLSSSQPTSTSSTGSSKSSFVFASGTDHFDACGVAAKSTCFPKASQVKGYATKAITTTSGVKSEVATWKPRTLDMFADSFNLGQITDNVYRESFSVRSYEVLPDQNASLEALMKYLQDTCINHIKVIGLSDSIGSTPETSKRNLIWVVIKMHVQVEHYPSWGDTLEVNTWMSHHGKNTMHRDWHVRNLKTGQTVMRATSLWATIHKSTRKFSKLHDEIKAEFEPYCNETASILKEDNRKFLNLNVETADYVINGLTTRWTDLDFNMHVNNLKYIQWILEGIPTSMLETQEVDSMVLEYRKECRKGSILHFLTAVSSVVNNSTSEFNIECEHLLQLKSGPVLLKGRTTWRPKV